MSISSGVQWWEEWQLHILVLGSLGIQFYLTFFAGYRKTMHNRPLLRFSIWLAYLGGEAVVIYALAILFNRHSKLRYTSVNGNQHDLELFWAPILLMHLAGQINISAYSIEDNQLWSRHFLAVVAQVTVAIYVFCKSWSSSADKRLLAAAILLFFIGILKCFDKSLALKRASFNTIVTSFRPAPRTKTVKREVELEEYIQAARSFVQQNQNPPELRFEDYEGEILHLMWFTRPDTVTTLFVDWAYSYDYRLTILKSFWLLDERLSHRAVSNGLVAAFNLIYTKSLLVLGKNTERKTNLLSILIQFLFLLLPIVPIFLFHSCHKDAYRGTDIKVTFILLYITYFFELPSLLETWETVWSHKVAQRSLLGLLAWKRRHTRLMGIAEFFRCKSLLDTYFGFWQCNSAKDITKLVRQHIKSEWTNHITDIESYWRFSDSRGQWALERSGVEETILGSICNNPFEESIILWHVATDFCFHTKGCPSHDCAKICRQISNYMMHLVFANPEMLSPGSRNLLTAAYDQLEAILQDDDGQSPLDDENGLSLMIMRKAELLSEGYIRDSWVLAQELTRLGDQKMWEVIKSVWIEMLCFSACRCSGYLHVKSLASGGEFLSFVWLLMSHAGLETYAERQQRMHLRLSKEERVEIAKQRIQEAEERAKIEKQRLLEALRNRGTRGLSTPQGTAPLNGQPGQEEGVASTSASEIECIAPAPAINIVVSP